MGNMLIWRNSRVGPRNKQIGHRFKVKLYFNYSVFKTSVGRTRDKYRTREAMIVPLSNRIPPKLITMESVRTPELIRKIIFISYRARRYPSTHPIREEMRKI